MDTMVVVLLLSAVVACFIILKNTAESNLITVEVAGAQQKNVNQTIREVQLLSTEMKNIQKDMDEILKTLEKINKKSFKK